MTTSHDPLEDAAFIAAVAPEGVTPRFSLEVALERPRCEVSGARLFATAHGVYEASVDGVGVTASVLNPGWTSYEWRLAYQEHDVTELIGRGSGSVRLDLLLGNG